MKRHKCDTRQKHLLRKTVIAVLLVVLGLAVVQTSFYIVNEREIPILNNFNFIKKEADISLGWNLILVNDDYSIPGDYEVELTELSNGEKVDSRIYSPLQKMFDDARAAGMDLFVREGYRTHQDQEQILEERIQQYLDKGYSRSEAKNLRKNMLLFQGQVSMNWA